MLSERYFQNRNLTQKALCRYEKFANAKEEKREKSWSIAQSKLALYRQAVVAFGDSPSEAHYQEIYRRLRSYWAIGRNGRLWDASEIFHVLTNLCQACSRRNLTLTTFGNEKSQRLVLDCLTKLTGLKKLKNGGYPVMAVSKNLHFFNQRLWVIYDTAVVENQVRRVFRKDWTSFDAKVQAETNDGWIKYYLTYLLWASHTIRTAYSGLMDDFADWFISAGAREKVKTDDSGEEFVTAKDFRDELHMSYATAFEFIAIGATLLENSDKPCNRD
jgi:hypothetical protein